MIRLEPRVVCCRAPRKYRELYLLSENKGSFGTDKGVKLNRA